MLASQVFDFLDQHRSCSIERNEFYSTSFGTLRRSLRYIATRLAEIGGEAAGGVADELRVSLSEWLTVPVPFDDGLLEIASSLGDPKTVEVIWGRDIRQAYEMALDSARDLQSVISPLRLSLHKTIQRLIEEDHTWRIYCHKRARPHFDSLFQDSPLPDACFLHSVNDYGRSAPFETLIKVGPLRTRGWGAVPDALISAPRFQKFIQMVWSGCSDEESFGYDPIGITASDSAEPTPQVECNTTWLRSTTRIGHDDGDRTSMLVDVDELKYFYDSARSVDLRRATLVEIDEEQGILYPPQAQVASFDPERVDQSAIRDRPVEETLLKGMFIIWPLLGSTDLGALQAQDGYYSRIWKERLRDEFVHNGADLVARLRSAGIGLRHLQSRVAEWCRPSSTVIHAPQQRRHFETIVKVLGIDLEAHHEHGSRSAEWWQHAWNEIAFSRGEAIQTGRQEHEIVNEEVLAEVVKMLPDIRQQAQSGKAFKIDIPPGSSIKGSVYFYCVQATDTGFLAPESALRTIYELATIEQWRA